MLRRLLYALAGLLLQTLFEAYRDGLCQACRERACDPVPKECPVDCDTCTPATPCDDTRACEHALFVDTLVEAKRGPAGRFDTLYRACAANSSASAPAADSKRTSVRP